MSMWRGSCLVSLSSEQVPVVRKEGLPVQLGAKFSSVKRKDNHS